MTLWGFLMRSPSSKVLAGTIRDFSLLPNKYLSIKLIISIKVPTCKGRGGQISDFFGFDIRCSPSYLVFRMGSLLSQLPALVERLRYDRLKFSTHFFAKMYGK